MASTRLGGRYEIVREIGEGGMGRVFRAIDTETGQTVAAKVLIAGENFDLQALLRFQQEGAVLATMEHPNIVRVFSAFLDEQTACIIMELLEGRPLTQIIHSEHLHLPRVKHLMEQVAAALAYAHGRNIVHRDVKPDNIMVVGNEHVKVTDFGIARILQEGGVLNTMAGTTVGTPSYMSPEQIDGSNVDGRSDVYSFGCVMYQMVTGRPPFEGEDPLAVAFQHVHKAPPPPGSINPELPDDWEALILKTLAKNPANRFQSAEALQQALASLDVSGHAVPRVWITGQQMDTHAAFEADVRPLYQETRSLLEQGRQKEDSGDLRGALRDYRAGLTVAPLGPLRDELEEAVKRVAARMVANIRSTAVRPAMAARGASVEAAVVTPEEQRITHSGERGETPAALGVAEAAEPVEAIPRGYPQARPGRRLLWPIIAGCVAVLALVAVAAVVFRSQGTNSSSVAVWGSQGGAPGQFMNPWGLALDRQGNIYVADEENNRIQKLSPAGKPLERWGEQGSGTGQFSFPTGVAVDPQGNIYVADWQNNRIQKLSPSGTPLAHWGDRSFDPDQFQLPRGVALDADGNIYVADTNNNRIQELSPSGLPIHTWGHYGSGPGQFAFPDGVAVDTHGNIYVADTNNNRIQKLSPGGKFLASWGRKGSFPGEFDTPQAVAVDAQGNIYVADWDNARIQKLSPSGRPLTQWGKTEAGSPVSGSGPGEFNSPQGVAVDARGNIYVADGGNDRIQKLSP